VLTRVYRGTRTGGADAGAPAARCDALVYDCSDFGWFVEQSVLAHYPLCALSALLTIHSDHDPICALPALLTIRSARYTLRSLQYNYVPLCSLSALLTT
jgi:hypothetical protein